VDTPDSRERDPSRAALEAPIRAACETGNHAMAVTLALGLYGTELLGFLRAMAHDDDLAADAFAELSEDMWRDLPGFRWQSSLRSWSYVVARNSLNQLRRDPRRRAERNLPLSVAPDIAEALRTATREIQRTDIKDEFRLLREQLDREEHELLLLRLDRELSWKEIARITGDPDEDLDTRAAMLRKKFERAKERLKKLAVSRGLLPG